jgi:aminopeptidase N
MPHVVLRVGLALAAAAAIAAGRVPASGSLAAPDGAGADELRRPFGGPRTERHWPRSRIWDLQHVRVELELDWEQRAIRGVATLGLSALDDGIERIELDAEELDVAAVELARGEPLAFWTRPGKLEVRLDRPRLRGETLDVVVRYRARPRKGLYFIGPDPAYPDRPRQVWTQGESEDTRYWIPLYDSPNDKTTSEIVVTVPDEMTAVSNGRLVAVRPQPASSAHTFHWRQDVAHSTYLVSLVVGEFDRHDAAAGAVPLQYYVPPRTPASTVARSFAVTPEILSFFADYIGVPFPFDKYAQTTVERFLWGGMENSSATTLTADTLHPESAEPNFTSEGLVAHELAHQWWGDLLTCRDWSHIWLNEGFATFFADLWFERRHGRDEYDYRRYRNLQEYLEEVRERYVRPIVHATYVDELDLFDEHAYPKGAMVLALLRGQLGERAFRESIQRYAREHAGGSVETADLRRAIAEATGQELDWFFEQWVHRSGHPELRVTSRWEPGAGLLHLAVEQTQELVELTPLFRLPLEVELAGREQVRRYRIEVARARDDFQLSFPEPPRRVRFDPDQLVPKTLEFAKPVEELVDLLLHDPNVIGRIWAGAELAERADVPAAAAALARSLHEEPFYGVRAEVAAAVGEAGSPEALELVLAATGDRDARVREKAAKALGGFHESARAAAALQRIVRDESSAYVVGAALEALGKVRAPDAPALEVLRRALDRESHREVLRRGALAGLGELGDARAVAILKRWSEHGRPPRARESAVEALGRFAAQAGEVRPLLTSLLHDPDVFVRRAAAKALGKLGDAAAIPELEDAAGREIERRVQREVELALYALRREKRDGADLPARVEELEREVRTLREKLAERP